MTVQTRSLSEVTHDAIHLLACGLGVVETARFLNQLGFGHGDYTKEREALFEGASTEDLIQEALRFREGEGA
ncbi:MAG: hypothetical protein AAFX41_03370 [Bacteroidota bacterium]